MSCETYRSLVYASVGLSQYRPLVPTHPATCPSIYTRAMSPPLIPDDNITALLSSRHRTKQLAGVALWGWFGRRIDRYVYDLLRSPNAVVRRAAARAIGRSQPTDAVQVLLDQFQRDPLPEVRCVIPALIGTVPDASERILATLHSQEPAIQAAIVDAIPSTTDRYADLLLSWMDSDPPDRALAALSTLSRRSELSDRVGLAWRRWLFHDSPHVRHAALRRWARVATIPHVAELVLRDVADVLRTGHDDNRTLTALLALSMGGDQELLAQANVEPYLYHPDAQVCIAAMLAMDHHRMLSSQRLITIMQSHTLPEVKVAAGWVFGTSEVHRPALPLLAHDALIPHTDDYYTHLGVSIARCCFGDDQALLPLLSLHDFRVYLRPWFADAVQQAVNALIYPYVHDTLVSYLRDHANAIHVPSYRILCARAAAEYNHPSVWEWISPLWKEPDEDIGVEILRILQNVASPDHLPVVIDSMVANPAWEEHDDVVAALEHAIDHIGERYYRPLATSPRS